MKIDQLIDAILEANDTNDRNDVEHYALCLKDALKDNTTYHLKHKDEVVYVDDERETIDNIKLQYDRGTLPCRTNGIPNDIPNFASHARFIYRHDSTVECGDMYYKPITTEWTIVSESLGEMSQKNNIRFKHTIKFL